MRRFAMFLVTVLLAVAAAPQFAKAQGYDPDQAAPKPVHSVDTVFVKAAPDTIHAQLPEGWRVNYVGGGAGESSLASGMSLDYGMLNADSSVKVMGVIQAEQFVIFFGKMFRTGNDSTRTKANAYVSGFVGHWQNAPQVGPYATAEVETKLDTLGTNTITVSSTWWPCFLTAVPKGYKRPEDGRSVKLFANYGDLMVDVGHQVPKWGKVAIGGGLAGLKYLNEPGDAQWVVRGSFRPVGSSIKAYASGTYSANSKRHMYFGGFVFNPPRRR